jgi:hypothetical protein
MAYELHDETPATEALAPETVTLKPSAVEVNKDERAEDRMKRLNLSNVPGHTYETEQIAKDRAEELKGKDAEPYKYEANGYIVKEADEQPESFTSSVESNNLTGSELDGLRLYTVTAEGDFTKNIVGKRNAEIYVTTHAEAHKDLPATISKD